MNIALSAQEIHNSLLSLLFIGGNSKVMKCAQPTISLHCHSDKPDREAQLDNCK